MPPEVRIGMLGSGFIGAFHADGLRFVPDARVAANYGAGAQHIIVAVTAAYTRVTGES